MPYCVYLRKSRADYEAEQRGEGETLSRHRSILLRLAARNHHPIGQIYQEIVSGESIAARPQMQALLTDVSAGKWQGVYVMEVERLARGDTMDQGLVAHAFKAAGVYIITPAKTYNPADPADEEYFEFSLFMSRREYKTINRRMQGGRAQSVREGKYICSRPPYGYRKVKITGDKGYTLAIHPQEAEVVRQVFRWYLEGIDGSPAGLVRIAAHLAQLHIPTGEQGSVWNASRVHRMLTNPAYIGVIQWGKNKVVRTVTPSGVASRRVTQPTAQQFPGLHPAIIEDEVFYAVQQKLHTPQAHIPVRRGASLSNPLVGLVYCSECGHRMGGLPASGRQPAKLMCRTRGCSTVQNYRQPVEQAILSTLRGWLEDPGAILPPPTSEPDEQALTTTALEGMRAEREKLLRQLDRLQDLVEQEVYTVEQYNTRYATLHERLSALDGDIAAAEGQLASHPVYCTAQELRPALVRLFAEYNGATPEQQNQMLKACISRVVYRKTQRGLTLRGVEYANAHQFMLDVYPKLKT